MIFYHFCLIFTWRKHFRVRYMCWFFDRLKPWPQIRGEVICVFFYFVRATMPFRLYSIYLIRLFLLHIFWYTTLFVEIAAPFEFCVYLAFNACYFIFDLYVSFCPHGYELLIYSCISIHICTYIQYFYFFLDWNWLQKREWYRVCDCIGPLYYR